MTYYLKYRPQSLKELDLESVRESLRKTVLSGNIPHAFLFSGPKGTGKTSAARILAKIINCDPKSAKQRSGKEPCNKCEQCKSITRGTNIDVVEIDAASHRGIDDIRSLRDAVKLSPSGAKKKVYIIDEAHMLTTEACNALLKTLEEPPDHVVFVLATTNPEKLIETIRSRTTEIAFPKPAMTEIVSSLTKVAKGEKIAVSKESIDLVAQASRGSFRDAAKILEQLISEKVSLKAEKVEDYLFKSGSLSADSFLAILAAKDTKKAVAEVEQLVASGGDVKDFIGSVLERIRTALLALVGAGEESLAGYSKADLFKLSELLIMAFGDSAVSPVEQLPLEIVIVKWCDDKTESSEDVVATNGAPDPAPAVKETKSAIKSGPKPRLGVKANINDGVWRDILAKIRPINTSIEALLRAAKPMCFDGKVLTLSVYYRFHKERLEEAHHRRVLEDVVAGVLGNTVRVVCTLTEPPPKVVDVQPAEKQEVPTLGPANTVLTEGGDKDIIKIAEDIFGN